MRDKDGEMVAEFEQFMNSSRDKGVNVQVVSRGLQPIMSILLIANVVVHYVRRVCSVLSWNIPKNTWRKNNLSSFSINLDSKI